MKMNSTSKAVFKLLLDCWALFAAFALKNWRTTTNKLQNGFPRPYPCIPLWILKFSLHKWHQPIKLDETSFKKKSLLEGWFEFLFLSQILFKRKCDIKEEFDDAVKFTFNISPICIKMFHKMIEFQITHSMDKAANFGV